MPLGPPLTLHSLPTSSGHCCLLLVLKHVRQAPRSVSTLVFSSGGAEHDALLMFRTHSFSFSVFSLRCCPLGELSLVFPCRRASCPITDDPISALLSCERTEYEWVVGGGRGERKTYQGEHINIAKYHRITAKPRK